MPVSLPSLTEKEVAARFLLQGHVQGIGVRPAIARLAAELHLTGSVTNQPDGVEVFAQGTTSALEVFARRLVAALPSAAVVERLTEAAVEIGDHREFVIERAAASGLLGAHVPRDLCVCEDCLSEVAHSGDRRHGYAFTSCTNCGPRYSILEAMPYERCDTSMQPFALCSLCREEYKRSSDRRFHAQTNACPSCGPSLFASDHSSDVTARGLAAIEQAMKTLRDGGIVAMKGVGGYQLLCDATSAEAVATLRQRKDRRDQPLAVMLDQSMITALPEFEQREFDSPRNPIVLVASSFVTGLAARVSSGLGTVGIMKPATPLHRLLLSGVARPLVVTSGNIEGEPLAFDNDRAQQSLPSIADVWLHHNRPIIRPIDDSVMRCIAGRSVSIRAARGIAPLPLTLDCDRQVLALGGHQKAAIALCNGSQSLLGPHIGDLDSVASRARYVEQMRQLMQLYGVEPEVIVHDLHPDYFTTRCAEEQNVPTIAVQHHHAHVVAGMLDHGWLDRTVLGIAFDGTGYGPDDTIWGGEFLLATEESFQRVASLRPFQLVGCERAIREPWRIAEELVRSVRRGSVDRAGAASRLHECGHDKRDHDERNHRNLPGIPTTSLGRLFDGVASLVLDLNVSSFEGQPAMMLEAACDPSLKGEYQMLLDDTKAFIELDWRPLITELLIDKAAGLCIGAMAMKFHRSIAAAVAAVAARYCDHPVVLSGGCFQNRFLTELIQGRLADHPQPVGLPGTIPPNDGGLAAGQLAVAAGLLRNVPCSERSRRCV